MGLGSRKKLVSYLSEVGKALVGRAPGDTVKSAMRPPRPHHQVHPAVQSLIDRRQKTWRQKTEEKKTGCSYLPDLLISASSLSPLLSSVSKSSRLSSPTTTHIPWTIPPLLKSAAAKSSTRAAIPPSKSTSCSKAAPSAAPPCPPAPPPAKTKPSNCATATRSATSARACSRPSKTSTPRSPRLLGY
jgi:hypothetical protein